MDRSSIGLSTCAYAKRVDSSGTIIFDDGVLLPGAVQADISITRDSVRKFADNGLIYSEDSFASGTLTLTEVGWADQDYCNLTGASYVSDGSTPPTYSVQSVANPDPDCYAFGFICDSIGYASGSWGKTYTAVVLNKVKFSEGNSSMQTRGESTSFSDPQLIGTIFKDENEVWREVKNFSTFSAAESWLKTKLDVA